MNKIHNSLFWKLSLFFLVSLLLLAGIFTYITYNASKDYAQETSQKLHYDLAQWIADHSATFTDGELNEAEIKKLFQSIMFVNPSVEVYLLDMQGEILTYFAPKGKVQLENVSLQPITTFLNDKEAFIKGEDPRNPGVYKIFSAAPLKSQDEQVGYLYVILAGEEYATVASMLNNSFKMKLATKSILITLLFSIIIGISMIWYLTKNLKHLINSVNRFKQGELSARVDMTSKNGELGDLGLQFNSMADTIVNNINEIKSVENLRKELIANASHDLRTPLTAIQGYAETLVILEDKLSKEEREKYTNHILSSTEKVKKLVDDLFEISKLESNHIKTKIEEFSIREMISDITAKYDLFAKSKSIEIAFDSNVDQAIIKADIALIDRVIQNLLDNALKHSPPKSTVTIELSQVGSQSNKEIQIAIKDTGIGIPKDELPYIFDRYKKAKGNKQKGSGLGLAIVKKILELHKSEIQVQSIVNQGTIFKFTLPLAQ